MHQRNIAFRSQAARRRITETSAALAEALGVPALGAIEDRERRDPAVAQMRELEEIADLLESVAATLLTGAHHVHTSQE